LPRELAAKRAKERSSAGPASVPQAELLRLPGREVKKDCRINALEPCEHLRSPAQGHFRAGWIRGIPRQLLELEKRAAVGEARKKDGVNAVDLKPCLEGLEHLRLSASTGPLNHVDLSPRRRLEQGSGELLQEALASGRRDPLSSQRAHGKRKRDPASKPF